MATCKQIRSETEGWLLSLNDINIDCGELRSNLEQLEHSMPLLKRITSSLGSDSGRVILHLDCVVSHYEEDVDKALLYFLAQI